MAYDKKKPPALVAKGIGGVPGSQIWRMIGTDPVTAVVVAGYISNAKALHMQTGDTLVYHRKADPTFIHRLIVGPYIGDVAQIIFPDIADVSTPLAPEGTAPTMELIGYINGKQVRAPLDQIFTSIGEGSVGIATYISRGIIELATDLEIAAEEDAERAVTPKGLASLFGVKLQRFSEILRLLSLLTLPGNAGKVIAVNQAETGFELITPATGGGPVDPTDPPAPSQRADTTQISADTTQYRTDGAS